MITRARSDSTAGDDDEIKAEEIKMEKDRSEGAEAKLIVREGREIGSEEKPMIRRQGVPQYYTIGIGRRPGIYVSWEVDSREVLGY